MLACGSLCQHMLAPRFGQMLANAEGFSWIPQVQLPAIVTLGLHKGKFGHGVDEKVFEKDGINFRSLVDCPHRWTH